MELFRLGLFFMLTVSSIPIGSVKAQTQDICQNKAAAKSAILCVGKLRNRVLMVTKFEENRDRDQLVYDLPLQALNGSMDKLYITGEKPVTIRQKWPQLYHNPIYGNITFGVGLYNAFVALDNTSEYLLITTRKSSQVPGVLFDLNSGNVSVGLSFSGNETQVLISSNELNKFYALQKGADRGLTIRRYRFASNSVVQSCALPVDSILPDDDQFFSICQVGNDSLMVTSRCEQPLLWPGQSDLLKGFVTESKFYLFGDESILIFSSQCYEKPDISFKYQTVPYASFIECSANVVVKKETGKALGMTIVIVLVVLIAVLIACLLCFREVRKRRQTSGSTLSTQSSKLVVPGGKISSVEKLSLNAPSSLSMAKSRQVSGISTRSTISAAVKANKSSVISSAISCRSRASGIVTSSAPSGKQDGVSKMAPKAHSSLSAISSQASALSQRSTLSKQASVRSGNAVVIK